MPHRDLIVVAASAGGIEALREVLGGLAAEVDAAVLVVLHIPPNGGRALPRILAGSTGLEVHAARDGEALEPGRVYVCVGDHHLLAGDGHVHVRQGPREHGHRPAADPLFRSAAAYYGPRVIAVVLSGTLSDGTAGLHAVRQQHGVAVVQDPEDALYDGMPASALEYVGADYVLPAKEIGPLLTQLVAEELELDVVESSDAVRREVALMEGDDAALQHQRPGEPSPWPCPDCNGVLWAIDEGQILRFRCRVGHAWTAESLLQVQGEGVEAALWMALRALEDRASLSRTLAERAERGGRRLSATRFRDDVGDLDRSIAVIRRLLSSDQAGDGPVPDMPLASGSLDG